MHAKPQHHKHYGLLKQLLILGILCISMDFIETLLTFSGCDEILVIVDQLTKQDIFILITIHCTSEDLALYLSFMCSPNTEFLNMSPPTAAPNLYPASSASSEKLWT